MALYSYGVNTYSVYSYGLYSYGAHVCACRQKKRTALAAAAHHIVMAYVVMALYSYGLYSYGPTTMCEAQVCIRASAFPIERLFACPCTSIHIVDVHMSIHMSVCAHTFEYMCLNVCADTHKHTRTHVCLEHACRRTHAITNMP